MTEDTADAGADITEDAADAGMAIAGADITEDAADAGVAVAGADITEDAADAGVAIAEADMTEDAADTGLAIAGVAVAGRWFFLPRVAHFPDMAFWVASFAATSFSLRVFATGLFLATVTH